MNHCTAHLWSAIGPQFLGRLNFAPDSGCETEPSVSVLRTPTGHPRRHASWDPRPWHKQTAGCRPHPSTRRTSALAPRPEHHLASPEPGGMPTLKGQSEWTNSALKRLLAGHLLATTELPKKSYETGGYAK